MFNLSLTICSYMYMHNLHALCCNTVLSITSISVDTFLEHHYDTPAPLFTADTYKVYPIHVL